jgi:hypothetical protein
VQSQTREDIAHRALSKHISVLGVELPSKCLGSTIIIDRASAIVVWIVEHTVMREQQTQSAEPNHTQAFTDSERDVATVYLWIRTPSQLLSGREIQYANQPSEQKQ